MKLIISSEKKNYQYPGTTIEKVLGRLRKILRFLIEETFCQVVQFKILVKGLGLRYMAEFLIGFGLEK